MTDELYQDLQFQDLLRVEGINFRGYGIVPKYTMFDTDLTLEAKAIYAYFCSFTGRGNTAFPGRDKILSDLQMSKNAYYHHFNLLTAQGYITVAQQQVNGLKSRNIYTLVSKPKKFQDIQSNPQKEEKYNCIRVSGLKSLGYGMIPKAVMQDGRLSVKSKGLYAFFSCLTGGGDTAFPLIKDTTYFLGISIPTYYKHYQPLLDLNYLTAAQRHIDGILGSNEYLLNEMPAMPDTPESPNAEAARKKYIKVIKTSYTGGSSRQSPKDNPVSNQHTKKEDTVKEDAVKPSKGRKIQQNQGFDQHTKKEDTVKEDTKKEDTKSNNIENQQYTESINHSVLKGTADEGRKNSASDNSIRETASVPDDLVKETAPATDAPISENASVSDAPAKETAPATSDRPTNRAQIEIAVRKATNYGQACENYGAMPEAEQDAYTHSVFCLFNEALIDMLSSEKTMNLNRQKVSSQMVSDKFIQCENNRRLHNNTFDTRELIELASSDYIKGCQFNAERGTEIKSPLHYMESCIWNAMLVGKSGLLKPGQSSAENGSGQQNQKSAPKNRFINFTQRDIDFAALERMELELLKGYM